MIKHLIKYWFWVTVIIITSTLLWSFLAIKLYVTSGFIAIAVGYIIGVCTAINSDRENAFFYWMASGVSSFFTYYLGKYIIYEYFSGLIDIEANRNILVTFSTILFKTERSTVAAFAHQHIQNFDVFDFLWPCATIIIALINARKIVAYKQKWNKLKKRLMLS